MQRTPFYQYHTDHGAKFVDFAGYEMPIMYRSIHEEHRQVRDSGGVFDVSHMGRLKLTGRHARRLVERLCTRYVTDMAERTCRYALICNEQGCVLDDILVYRYADHWLLVVNAANRKKIVEHIAVAGADMAYKLEDLTDKTAMVAIQGPRVMEQIGGFSSEVPTLKRYAFCEKNLLIIKMTISRTGYTGEDGVEIILNANMAAMAIKMFLKEGKNEGKPILMPVGLGARDTLRMEAAMPLYGHELDETIDPLTAGLAFAVTLDKDQRDRGEPFVGQPALQRIAAEGPTRKRIGLKLDGRRTARQGMTVKRGDRAIGGVTSGCLSPTLGYPIAMAYIDVDAAGVGDTVQVDFNGKPTDAEVVALPFYKAK